jgi:hypothetical protein
MLLDLPSEVTAAIGECSLKPSVAEELLYLNDQDEKSKLANLIIERHLTIKSVRGVVKDLTNEGESGAAGTSETSAAFQFTERTYKSIFE